MLMDNSVCRRLPGTDGKAKMSKSIGNCIYLSDDAKTVSKKVMSMFTDPNHLRKEDPGTVEGNTVFTYLDAFCISDDFAAFLPEYANLEELKDHFRRGGLGDVTVKRFLNSVLERELEPIRARRLEFEKDPDAVYDMLKEGSIKAAEHADQTLERVRRAIGLSYFKR